MEFKKNFRLYLKELRKNKGISQKELAEKIGVSPSMVTKYEQGINYPNEITLARISSFFDVPINNFINEDIDIQIINASLNEMIKNFQNKITQTEEEENEDFFYMLDFFKKYFNIKITYEYSGVNFHYEDKKIFIPDNNFFKFKNLIEKDILFNLEKYLFLLGIEDVEDTDIVGNDSTE